ncbi:adenosylcobinamide-GDP ribazoletransferase [Planomonospora sp. ID82291]|uniref:adenosylcobinamide-GDP ribazoletransferase n=1 Tax=Planomonospora sp. ID82291 TaxID=2738136 RepID=UPI0018C35683|nr:adenosylcobinamide-GDP ribazoletransferase [Planomonospora sp. ID82291]MBG0816245.1 adenosylcobinamide-GDP ribazoletransferase [Planomonospora sp. ID82291]
MSAEPPPGDPGDPENPGGPDASERPSTFGDGLRLAVGTLSVFPVRPGTVDRRAGGRAMALAPLVGALLGGVAAVVLSAALRLGVSPLLASVLAVGTLALLTRALHLDGLADLADGLGSGRPAEQALDIMKRSDIGPFGVVTLVLVLGVQVAALAEASAAGYGPVALVAACVAGRLAITRACREGVPAARQGGLGATVAGTVRRGPALAATALSLAGLAVLTSAYCLGALRLLPPDDAFGRRYAEYTSVEGDIVFYDGSYAPLQGIGTDPAYLDAVDVSFASIAGLPPGWSPFIVFLGLPAAAVAAGLLAARVLRRRAVRRLGGITGDVLGALAETAAAAALLACAALG